MQSILKYSMLALGRVVQSASRFRCPSNWRTIYPMLRSSIRKSIPAVNCSGIITWAMAQSRLSITLVATISMWPHFKWLCSLLGISDSTTRSPTRIYDWPLSCQVGNRNVFIYTMITTVLPSQILSWGARCGRWWLFPRLRSKFYLWSQRPLVRPKILPRIPCSISIRSLRLSRTANHSDAAR